MKPLPLLLAVSLAANAVLVAVYISRVPAAGHSSVPALGEPPAAPKPVGEGGPDRLAEIPTYWSPEIGALMDRMRAAGFPLAAVRAAVRAGLNERYADKIQRVYGLAGGLPEYWKTSAVFDGFMTQPGKRLARIELKKDLDDEFRSLLGGDAVAPVGADEAARYARQFGDLAPAKAVQIETINAEFDFRKEQINGDGQGLGSLIAPFPDDVPRQAYFESERRAALARLLTPGELEDYDIRNSRSVRNLQLTLSLMEPSEAEYRAIARAYIDFDQKYTNGDIYMTMPAQQRERSSHISELNAAIVAALTPERSSDYRAAAADPLSITRLLERYRVPFRIGLDVNAIRMEVQKQAGDIRNDQGLGPDLRSEALVTLSNRANAQVTTALGKELADLYISSSGSWLKNIAPTPSQK